MKYLDPAEQILFPVILSLRADTVHLLSHMAKEMDITLEELISSIAEDSVTGLSSSNNFLDDVVIPDSCSTEDLMNSIKSGF